MRQLEHVRLWPRSFRTEYDARVEEVLAWGNAGSGTVTEDDLVSLPEPVAAYVRWSGAVGRPHVAAVRAHFHGRIRGGADEPWMAFTGEQVNTFDDHLSRLFHMHALRGGLPVDVLHTFIGARARMRVKLLSVVPMVDAESPELTRAEMVTLLNDMLVLAPGALVGRDVDWEVAWETLDPASVRVWFTHEGVTVSADLFFDDTHRLVDFVSDDRLRTAVDGRIMASQRWSTPLGGYREIDGRGVATYGEGRWHAPQPEGEFTYLELDIDAVDHDPQPESAPQWSRRTGRGLPHQR